MNDGGDYGDASIIYGDGRTILEGTMTMLTMNVEEFRRTTMMLGEKIARMQ